MRMLKYSPRKPLPPQTTSFFFAAEAIVVSSVKERSLKLAAEIESGEVTAPKALHHRRAGGTRVPRDCQDSRGEEPNVGSRMCNAQHPHNQSWSVNTPAYLRVVFFKKPIFPPDTLDSTASDTSTQSGGALSQICPPPQQTSALRSVKAHTSCYDRELTTRRTSA
jgi:hypothetical protein